MKAIKHINGDIRDHTVTNLRIVDLPSASLPPDRLAALQAELAAERRERLANFLNVRAALEPFVRHYEMWMDDQPDNSQVSVFPRHTVGDLRRARAALEK